MGEAGARGGPGWGALFFFFWVGKTRIQGPACGLIAMILLANRRIRLRNSAPGTRRDSASHLEAVADPQNEAHPSRRSQ